MNYEKAYKAVLQTARQWIKDGCTDKEKICLECVFPELRESEDERIRKELKEAFEAYDIESMWNGIPIRSIFAWLEKQKEQKQTDLPAGFYYIDLDGNKYYSKEFRYGDMKLKMGEHKPAWSEEDNGKWDDEYMLNTIIGNYNLHAEVMKKHGDMRQYNLEKSMENWLRMVVKPLVINKSKPVEWSEKDKEMLRSIIEDVTPVGECPDYPTDDEREYYYNGQDKTNWLKDLPNRFNLQHKQEWSEEDEENIDSLVIILHKALSKGISCEEEVLDLTDWLKSIRPVKQEWSEEDENRLNAVVELLENTSAIHPNYSHRKLIIWLQSLRPAKQEWSEEDIQMYNRIKEDLSYPGDFPDYPTKEENEIYDDCQEKLNWFEKKIKSLRLSWKPSEEQMEALQHAIDACESEWAYQDDELRSLLIELKKLM